MVAKEYADFEPKTTIPAAEFIARQEQRNITLRPRDCIAVENALKEYERFCYLTGIGEGKQLPPKLRKLEDAIKCLKMSIEAVREEEGYIWEYLLDKSNAEIRRLGQLLEQCEKLNREVPRRTAAKSGLLC